jgi:hypothetical protein
MEEADVLSQRIGIITDGKLRCAVIIKILGSLDTLKKFIW